MSLRYKQRFSAKDRILLCVPNMKLVFHYKNNNQVSLKSVSDKQSRVSSHRFCSQFQTLPTRSDGWRAKF